jgi:hypothetical protein
MNRHETRVTALSLASVVAFVLSWIAPRALANDTGFAAGASAALTFFAIAAVGGVLAILTLVVSLRRRADLRRRFRWLGIVPLLLLAAFVSLLVLAVRERMTASPQLAAVPGSAVSGWAPGWARAVGR